MRKTILTITILLFATKIILSQTSYEDVSNINIYLLIDELANEKIITINSAIKPYKRNEIIYILNSALKNENLNKRLRKDINIYLNKYNLFSVSKQKDNRNGLNFNKKTYHLSYLDFPSNLIIKPIWGINRKIKKKNSFYHMYGGLSVDATINKKWHFYANLIDNTMSEPLAMPDFYRQENGGNYKTYLENDFSEMQGGIIHSFSFGNISFIKEHIEWGDNYFGSNILSGRTPSFPMIKLNLFINNKIQLNYFHGWLVSEDIDSTATYISNAGYLKPIFREKFIAANMISVKLFKYSYLSFGNSIIYSDLNGIHPGYIIPFFFYKSIDHSLNYNIENQNSQLFLNFSSREVKKTHIYSSIFVDEFQKRRIFSDTLNNFLSFKFGTRISNWPMDNITNTIELNFSTPMTYKHTINATTFESNNFNLGHYMRDNSKTINYQFSYKFISRINLNINYLYAMHGDELDYNFSDEYDPTSIPIRKNKTWDCTSYKISLTKEFKENIYLSIEYEIIETKGYENTLHSAEFYLNKFTPEFYKGKNHVLGLSLNIGF